MLKPDCYFKQYDFYFPAKNRNKARDLFRRAIRHYYVMRRKFVIDPATGTRTHRVHYGTVIKQQKKQQRLVKLFYTGQSAAGRPARPEIKLLVARLFVLWGMYASSKATFPWKKTAIETDFDVFMHDLLPRLGASDVKRYAETHWRERRK
jgi:hypothetical protein